MECIEQFSPANPAGFENSPHFLLSFSAAAVETLRCYLENVISWICTDASSPRNKVTAHRCGCDARGTDCLNSSNPSEERQF